MGFDDLEARFVGAHPGADGGVEVFKLLDADGVLGQACSAQDVQGVGVAAAGGDDDEDAGLGGGGLQRGEVAGADLVVEAEEDAVEVDGDEARGGVRHWVYCLIGWIRWRE